jgi:predicted secreted Zn-dependent protease
MFISTGNQLMANLRAALGIFWLICIAVPAAAEVQITTNYNYFPVTGKTARQIYINILRHGPAIGDPTAMASTAIKLSPSPTFMKNPQCNMQRFTAKLTFQINLPRHVNLNGLSPEMRQTWTSFATRLKTHEERHRSIWTACAERLSKQASQTPPGSCAALKTAYSKFSRNFFSTCKAENDAFDAADEANMLTTPFIRRVANDK